MEPTYVYAKKRAEFGRHCLFDNFGPVVEEDLHPDPLAYQDYIKRNPCHVASQNSRQYAVHEVDVPRIPIKNTGMFHFEGGWPKDINPKDEEATARFRRRIEKDDDWAPKLRHLFRTMEHRVRQNNTVNIYEHYFDDIVPDNLITPRNLRVVNSYTVPKLKKEPVNWISWSPDRDMKIIVSYCVMDFKKITKVQGHSYIWNIENSNVPVALLKTSSPLVISEYHPRDCIRVASGLMTGQVCIWDLRKSMKPIAFSRLDSSHRYPISSLKWIQSKGGYEFFTSSFDGQVMWWDMRNLQEPTSILTFDLESPGNPNLDRASGVSCMNFDPAVTTKFLIGLENGITVSGSRKATTPEEKMSLRFDCHYGPVISIDRNRSVPKCFLTIGDWTARIWSEDTKEGALVSTKYVKKFLTGGCWSKLRHSLFYTINRTGHLKSWDLLEDLQTPVTSLRLCNDLLTAITHHEDEPLMAIGSTSGNVYLVEASEGLVRFSKDEKSNFSTYIDRCSRFAKAIDVRLKEMKLHRRMIVQEDNRKKGVEKGLIFEMNKKKGKSIQQRKNKDKHRSKEHHRIESKILNNAELVNAEKAYFRIINEEISKFDRIMDPDDEFRVKEHSKVTKHTKERKISAKVELEKTRSRKTRDSPKSKNEIVILKKSKVPDTPKIEEVHHSINSKDSSKSLISEAVATKTKIKALPGPSKMPREMKPLLSTKICEAPCKMEICCKDISDEIKSKKKQNKRDEKLLRNLTEQQDPDAETKTWRSIPGLGSSKSNVSFTQDEKMEILRNMSAPPKKMIQIFARHMSDVVNKNEPD